MGNGEEYIDAKQYMSEGNKLYKKKEYNEAIKCYEKAMDFQNYKKEAYYAAAVCLIQKGNPEKALEYLRLAIVECNGINTMKDAKIFFNAGVCCLKLYNIKKAYHYFMNALCLDESDMDCVKALDLCRKELNIN